MRSRANLGLAIILIIVGAWFLAVELNPAVRAFAYGSTTWPLQVVGVGVLLALVALLTWTPWCFLPASIVSGIGGLLYWQNTTGNWGSWAYTWTLIPGFVGLGLLLSGLLTRRWGAVTGGIWTILSSLVLFVIFGAFLGGFGTVARLWPVLLILLGILMLARIIFKRG